MTLRAASVSVETTQYDSFEVFVGRLTEVVKAAEPVIDCDFFTRVGLRYINRLPIEGQSVEGWINSDLGGLLASGVLGEPTVCYQRVAGKLEGGHGYMMQHGWGHQELQLAEADAGAYVLDFDLSAEDIPLSDAISTVEKLHADEFSLFQWAIGPRARAYLGESAV